MAGILARSGAGGVKVVTEVTENSVRIGAHLGPREPSKVSEEQSGPV